MGSVILHFQFRGQIMLTISMLCFEVFAEEDDEHNRKLLCRVYDQSQLLHSRMKIISESCLKRKAIMVTNEHCPEVLFLAGMHV
ncbi:hypothetical protein ACJMK2_030016 [Sinanodonta woodiana]|uniref:Uncharacterized protein n=1 Tax=Sinanodonta woodiana TaxID=1069815 RepID=A0ABD3XDI4_SINWO